jgi:energy-coupling factor transport system ATP-binding protein
MLAAALAHGPSAVLLDEPTVGQDRRTWAMVVGACRAATGAGTAAALATHDTTAVEALTDRALALRAGRPG